MPIPVPKTYFGKFQGSFFLIIIKLLKKKKNMYIYICTNIIHYNTEK